MNRRFITPKSAQLNPKTNTVNSTLDTYPLGNINETQKPRSESHTSTPLVHKKIQLGELGIYEGQVSLHNNIPNGQGRLDFDNGFIYVGEFNDGKMHGNGILEDVEGNIYEGDFVNGLKQGKGREEINSLRLVGKVTYEGKFKKDLRNGYGNFFIKFTKNRGVN